MKWSARATAALGVAFAASCAAPNLPRARGAREHASPPASARARPPAKTKPADALAEPPPSAPVVLVPFPSIQHETLSNGLGAWIVTQRHLPLVRVVLVVKSGRAEDGAKAGVAELTAESLARGGAGSWGAWQWRDKIAALGGELEVSTSLDTVRLALSVTAGHLDGALAVLALAVTRPSFSPHEFLIARERAAERAESSTADATRLSLRVLFRELYQLPASAHPYARYANDADALRHVTLGDCQRWFRAHVSPTNAFVIVAGDVRAANVKRALERRFAHWKGKAPSAPSFTAPMPPDRTRVFVVDRPRSHGSEIRIATLGPGLGSKDFAALEVAGQIVADAAPAEPDRGARDRPSGVEAFALAHPPAPIVARAGARTSDTARIVGALLQRVDELDRTGPTDRELDVAVRRLVTGYEPRIARVRALARLVTPLGLLDLPNDFYDTFRATLDDLDAGDVRSAARAHWPRRHLLVVVAGDARRIAQPLTRFGPVSVIDPSGSLAIARTLAADPTAH